MDHSKENSLKHSPPSAAILPPSLATAKTEREKARRVSHELQKAFEDLSRKVEPDLDPDEERDEPDTESSLELASLGVELALKKKEEFRLEREVVIRERDANLIHPHTAAKRLRDANHRYLSAGDDLWRQKIKKARFDDPGAVRLLDPRSRGFSDCLLTLYQKCDGLTKTKKRPSSWREDALTYYAGKSSNYNKVGGSIWCHVIASWNGPEEVKAAHIVPFFLDSDEIGEILFGNRAPSLRRAGNALLLTSQIKYWFDTYHIVIVPVDVKEIPIIRWRVDVISSDIRNSVYNGGLRGGDLHGKELTFLNDKRPVSRFMYFHFIMALVRIKDIKRSGWQDVWAKYYEQRPFPTPGNYLRRSMLLALATHFGTADMSVIESWITDHGFESPLKFTDDETTEVARRVHLAVEEAISRADRDPEDKSDDEDEEEDEETEEDNEDDMEE